MRRRCGEKVAYPLLPHKASLGHTLQETKRTGAKMRQFLGHMLEPSFGPAAKLVMKLPIMKPGPGTIIVTVLVLLAFVGIALSRKQLSGAIMMGLLVFFALDLGLLGAIGLIANVTPIMLTSQPANPASLTISAAILLAATLAAMKVVRIQRAELAEIERLNQAELAKNAATERRSIARASARHQKLEIAKASAMRAYASATFAPRFVIDGAKTTFGKLRMGLFREESKIFDRTTRRDPAAGGSSVP